MTASAGAGTTADGTLPLRGLPGGTGHRRPLLLLLLLQLLLRTAEGRP